MFTKLFIEKAIFGFIQQLIVAGYHPTKIYLFGSYPKACATSNSDIDLAVWASEFSGNRMIDIQQISSILVRYHPIDLHTFSSHQEPNDFMLTIEKEGVNYSKFIEKNSLQQTLKSNVVDFNNYNQ